MEIDTDYGKYHHLNYRTSGYTTLEKNAHSGQYTPHFRKYFIQSHVADPSLYQTFYNSTIHNLQLFSVSVSQHDTRMLCASHSSQRSL
jgi:hypothetical protein